MRYIILLLLLMPGVTASLTINEIMPNPIGADNAPQPRGEWVELYNPTSEKIYLEDYYLTDLIEYHKLEILEEYIEPYQYLTIYRDEDGDFALNNNGDEVKLFHNKTLIDKMEYKKSEQSLSIAKTEQGWMIQTPSLNKENYPYDYTPQCDWELEIWLNETITLDPYFKVKINNVYGGKNNLTLTRTILNQKEIERLYENLTFSIITKTSYTYKPQLKPGPHRIQAAIESLNCNDTNMDNNKVETLVYIPETVNSLEIVNSLNTTGINYLNPTGNIVYESKGRKAKTYAVYAFCAIIIVLIVYWGIKDEIKKNHSTNHSRSSRCTKRTRRKNNATDNRKSKARQRS
ncbi:MAG: lamin tail domain-containing protein [archaeon]